MEQNTAQNSLSGTTNDQETAEKFKHIKSKAETALKVLKYVLTFLIVVTLINVIANIADIYHKNFTGWLALSIVSIAVSIGLVITLICLYTDINKTIKKYKK